MTAEIDLGPLVYGTLPMGPLQAGMTPDEGGKLIAGAMELGVKTVDTAEMYGTYAHIGAAVKSSGRKPLLITKSHASTAAEARKHFLRAIKETGIETIHVANVHGARLADPFAERAEVFAEILKMKDEGLVEHLGLSTHRAAVAENALNHPEVEVIHPLINKTGLGIIDGGPERMAAAIKALGEAGRTIYAMKALAGGNLISDALESINYVRALPGVHSVAVGMLSEAEVKANTALFMANKIDGETWRVLSGRQRKLAIMKNFCTGCGNCVEACTNDALSLIENVACVDEEKCVLCGYCAAACPNFLLRVI